MAPSPLRPAVLLAVLLPLLLLLALPLPSSSHPDQELPPATLRESLLPLLGELSPPIAHNVFIRDPAAFEEKLEALKAGGPQALQVISDFDMTLTRFWANGVRGHTTHGAIGHSRVLGEEFREATRELFERYYPLEITPGIPSATKAELMESWWTQSHALMVQHNLKSEHLKRMVEESNIHLRDGAEELLRHLHEEQVPVLIFSAGVSNIIKHFLDLKGTHHENVHVISNQMRFDPEGNLLGFDGELIHTLNKNANVLRKVPTSWAHQETRKNILLFGDNLGDIHMAEGLNFSHLISIGFLNDRIGERLDDFQNTFDVVLTNDASFEFPLLLLKHAIH